MTETLFYFVVGSILFKFFLFCFLIFFLFGRNKKNQKIGKANNIERRNHSLSGETTPNTGGIQTPQNMFFFLSFVLFFFFCFFVFDCCLKFVSLENLPPNSTK
eukprot:PhF_6_TR11698/c3_g1_i6/m.19009